MYRNLVDGKSVAFNVWIQGSIRGGAGGLFVDVFEECDGTHKSGISVGDGGCIIGCSASGFGECGFEANERRNNLN
jgi:hypothetical protein